MANVNVGCTYRKYQSIEVLTETTFITPPFRRNKEQTEEIFRGMCPTVTPFFTTATAKGSALVATLALARQILTDTGFPHVFIDVIASYARFNRINIHVVFLELVFSHFTARPQRIFSVHA